MDINCGMIMLESEDRIRTLHFRGIFLKNIPIYGNICDKVWIIIS